MHSGVSGDGVSGDGAHIRGSNWAQRDAVPVGVPWSSVSLVHTSRIPGVAFLIILVSVSFGDQELLGGLKSGFSLLCPCAFSVTADEHHRVPGRAVM